MKIKALPPLLLVVVVVLFAGSVVCACETAQTSTELAATDPFRAVQFFGGDLDDYLGYIVNAAGDLNGDGLADFVLTAPYENNDVLIDVGTVFVVFGRSAAAWASAQFNFSETAETPDAASWVRIRGTKSNMYLGMYGVTHGDFNGDGLSDLLISTFNSRTAHVVYGHSGVWRSFNLTEIETGTLPGFVFTRSTAINAHVGNAGDMNGDGIEDMLLSSDGARIIFGEPGATRAAFNISNIDGTNGFWLTDGKSIGNGPAMGSAGDINGDGLSDLAIGSKSQGLAFILFARNVTATGQQWPAALIDLNTWVLDGTNGFTVLGPSTSQLGTEVLGTGDVNGDGFADIFLGSSDGNGGAWIVFGHPAPWEPLLNVSLLNGANGFHFSTTASNEFWGYSGGGAGDFNGDGFDDILIGGYNALNSSGTATGAAAILFGRPGPWPAELGRDDVVGSVGFLVDGPSAGSWFGSSVRGVGDVNGDGLDDFVVGARIYNAQQGYVLLVFGVNDHCAVCSNTTDECLVCTDGFILNGTICEAQQTGLSSSNTGFSSSSSSSAHHQQGVSVVVIIKFIEDVTDPTELQEEIASALGIDAGLVSVVVISPTEVEVTIIGSEETAQRLVDIINNGGAGSDGSGLGLLRKAIDAHIRKDTDNGSSDDGVDAASHVALSHLVAVFIVTVAALL